jgi:glycosyltransferase involved in cell wall biosynthesis
MTRPLHVGVLAPVWWSIAPDRGGIEQIVYLEARELRARGHRVTLVASGDSVHDDRLLAVCPDGVADAMHAGRAWDYAPYEQRALALVLEHGGAVDVWHSHVGVGLAPFARLLPVPSLHTLHTSITDDMRWLLRTAPGVHVSTVSRWQAAALDGAADADVVANGIDVDAFPFSATADDYLLVLGRIEARKGTDVAIDVARAAGVRLVVAGSAVDREWFAAHVAPRLDDDRVRWVGHVGGAEKLRLLQRARALLFPVQWEEAFGLVLVEAMACGTPVLALARGAVPEIVVPGVNGFHATDPAALPALVERLGGLDRARVRASVVPRFSHRRMVDDYERLFRRLVAQRPPG